MTTIQGAQAGAIFVEAVKQDSTNMKNAMNDLFGCSEAIFIHHGLSVGVKWLNKLGNFERIKQFAEALIEYSTDPCFEQKSHEAYIVELIKGQITAWPVKRTYLRFMITGKKTCEVHELPQYLTQLHELSQYLNHSFFALQTLKALREVSRQPLEPSDYSYLIGISNKRWEDETSKLCSSGTRSSGLGLSV